jgi:hypothetical protein
MIPVFESVQAKATPPHMRPAAFAGATDALQIPELNFLKIHVILSTKHTTLQTWNFKRANASS